MTIGKPRIVGSDGQLRAVPGQQPWALLARLLVAKRPLSRHTLASELFCDVEDPLGALRWCLASLRRALGPGTLRGDPIEVDLPDGTYVDIWNLSASSIGDIEPAEFLEGLSPTASAEFSTWLLITREQISSQMHEQLRRSAIEALASQNFKEATCFSERAVHLRPLDESGHILLVKSLAMAGRMEVAAAHIEATEQEFEKQIGEKPSPALRAAARKNIADAPKGVSRAATIDSLVKSGTAAVAAGAVDAGLDCLRRAAGEAELGADAHLVARTLHELGTALVHAIRGFDDEGAIVLRRAADAACSIGSSQIAAASLRELGYLESLAGRRPTAQKYLREAMEFAHSDDEALAGIHAVTGFNLVDWGQSEAGLSHFEQSLAFSRKCGNRRREIWALGIGAWGQLRAGRPGIAEDWLKHCLALCDEIRWIAFRPWPQALLAEANMLLHQAGNSTQIQLEESLALSSQMGDPCWEAANARAISIFQTDAGDHATAERWLDHARQRCCSVTDAYAGLLVEIIADQMRLQTRRGTVDKADAFARELLSLAARTHADAHLDIALETLNSSKR